MTSTKLHQRAALLARHRNYEIRFAELGGLPRRRRRLPLESAIRRSLSGAKGLRP